MNMRVKQPIAVAMAPVASAGVRAARRVAQASVVRIAEEVSALFFDLDHADGQAFERARLGGVAAGAPLPRPLASTRLPLRRGGVRYVLLIPFGAERLAIAQCRLELDGAPVAALDPSWLQSPLAETVELIDGLTDDGRSRLLRMFLTTGGALFGSGRTRGYGAAVADLLALLAARPLASASVCRLGAAARLFSFRLPSEAPAPEIDVLFALEGDAVSRVGRFSTMSERTARGLVLHVHAPAVCGGRRLVGLGAEPLVLETADDAAAQPLAPWLARRSVTTRRWVEGLLDDNAPRDQVAGALLRELRHGGRPEPEAALRHFSATPGGVLALVEIKDPEALLTGVRLETASATLDLAVPGSSLAGGDVTRLAGFFPVRIPSAAEPWALRVVYASGRLRTVGEARPETYRGEIPECFAAIDPAVAAEALCAARLSVARRRLAPMIEQIGAPPSRPAFSLVVNAGSNPDMIRARAAALFAEPGARRAEIVYHARPAQAPAVRRLLAECLAVFGLSARLVVLDASADPAERLLAALEAARGPRLLVLGPDSAPLAPGWLEIWTRALGRGGRPAMLGGTLLGADGAVRHAGGREAAAAQPGRIEPRWVGLPVTALPGVASAPTAGVTADCVGLNAAAVAALGEPRKHYGNPDVLLIDLAHRLRRGRTGARTLLDGRFVHFGPERGADTLDAAIDARAIARLRADRTGVEA